MIQALLIMTLASVVTGFTTLSMYAICTNGEIKTGGAYFLISRALGTKKKNNFIILFNNKRFTKKFDANALTSRLVWGTDF